MPEILVCQIGLKLKIAISKALDLHFSYWLRLNPCSAQFKFLLNVQQCKFLWAHPLLWQTPIRRTNMVNGNIYFLSIAKGIIAEFVQASASVWVSYWDKWPRCLLYRHGSKDPLPCEQKCIKLNVTWYWFGHRGCWIEYSEKFNLK